jgi:Glycine zipper
MYGITKPQAAGWKWKAYLGTALAPLLLVAGCETHTGTGLLAGGGLGALAGGAIGAATGHVREGALIGAAAGATLGGVTGAAADHHEYRQAVRADAQRRALGLQDVVSLTQSGTSDQIIINQINTSGTAFHLSGAEIQWLHDNGVRDGVIEAMQATANRPPVVYVNEPPPVVFVEPPPPIGVGFVIRGGR